MCKSVKLTFVISGDTFNVTVPITNMLRFRVVSGRGRQFESVRHVAEAWPLAVEVAQLDSTSSKFTLFGLGTIELNQVNEFYYFYKSKRLFAKRNEAAFLQRPCIVNKAQLSTS